MNDLTFTLDELLTIRQLAINNTDIYLKCDHIICTMYTSSAIGRAEALKCDACNEDMTVFAEQGESKYCRECA